MIDLILNSIKKTLTLTIIFIGVLTVNAQNLVWTGNANDGQFFNENNWKDDQNGTIPKSGTIEPNTAINKNLCIKNYEPILGGSAGIAGNIVMGQGNLSIVNATIKLGDGFCIDMGSGINILLIDSSIVYSNEIKNASVTLSGDSKLYLFSNNPIDNNSKINIISYDAWIFAPALNAQLANTGIVNKISILGQAFSINNNATINQYYNGSAINPFQLYYKPLRFFDNENQTGTYGEVVAKTVFSDTAIPNNLNKKISSFILKKGYMVTLAVEGDGSGISQVYIASESDLYINKLPTGLNDNVSFIRVIPWIWVNKKGTGGDVKGVNASWYYNWGSSNISDLDREYSAMTWGKSAIDTKDDVNAFIRKTKITHIMSFNESDNCNDQSGKYGSLCVVDTAVIYQKNLMKTGLRILSPSCREGEELNWVKNMNTLAVPLNTRMDAIGMHWYDWGASPSTTPDEDPAKIFARFKAKVNACYNYYKMPIWITEFNANKFRNTWVQDGFLKLALPWLESTWFVERYAYFQPFGGFGDFFDANGVITSTGSIYLNQVSTPSIKEQDYNKLGSNLQKIIDIPLATNEIQSKKMDFEIFPNPVKNEMIVTSTEYCDCDLVNLQGVIVKSFSTNKTIGIETLPKGIYLVCCSGFSPQKLLIQ
jgi:hypothetical protein